MATKKITELPFINTLSGSSVYDNPSVNSVIPVVLYGTTNQITIENFSKFTNLYAAQTGSQNIFTQNQWFNTTVSASNINVGTLGVGGNTTIAGTLGVGGNGTIGGNLVVNGKLTAQEIYTEITSASIIFESGSTKFGDDTGDKHEFTGSINVSGSVIYNGVILTNVDANTIQKLQQTTQSLQVATASLQTFTASQDVRNFILSQITASFAGEIGGLEAYTASLKTAAIVSSSTQILNYNIFATTASNTFVGNQNITGSLSISAGEFNVITGSGNMTSSLIFDHTQNDGVTLGLRHNDRLSVADHIFNVNVWAAGVYTTFVRNGAPYSILNVEAFDDNKIYLYRDTRLFNKSLVIDNNLTVQKGIIIGSGSLSIPRGQFSAISGSGALTSSLSFTHTEVDPITGDATLALRYRNNQVGPENNAWKFVATDNGVQVRYDQLSTSNKNLFTLSSFGSNFDKLLIWRDTRLFGTGLTVDDSLLVKGVITGSLLATNGVVSSSNQLFELNQFTASQDGRNLTLSTVTGSLIGITNGLMAFTAALDNTYATDAQLYQLYQATRSLELHSGSMVGVTNGLMAYTASNTSLNTGLRGEVDGIQAYTASLKGQAIVSSSTQVRNYDVFALNSNLFTATGSLIGITNGLMAFTAALDSTYATDAQLFQLYQATRSIELTTGSLIGITNGLMAFTASLDNTFATDAQLLPILQATRSLELLSGSLIGITNGLMAFTAALDSTYATDAQLYQLYAETASIKAEIGGIEAYTASLKGASIVSSSQQITNYYKFAETASANIFYNYQAISGSKLELHTSDANGGLVINSKATATQTFITLLDRGTNDNSIVATFEDTNGSNQLGGLKIEAGRKDNQAGIILKGKNKVANSGAVNGYITSVIGNAYSDNALTTLTTGVTGKSISFLGQDTELANLNFNGDLTITNGNLVMANGKGIDFSATANSGSSVQSEILNDYEEGTWTPTDASGGSLTFTVLDARYTKIGRQVQCFVQILWPTNSDVNNAIIGGLPFSKASTSGAAYGAFVVYTTYGSTTTWLMTGATNTSVYSEAGANLTNTNLSAKQFRLVWIYEV